MYRIGKHYTLFRQVVDQSNEGLLVEDFLLQHIDYLTEDKAAHLIETQKVLSNGTPVGHEKLVHQGDSITAIIARQPEEIQILPEDIDLNIVFEDADVVVIDKPAGMVMHPGPGHWTGSVANALAYRYDNLPVLRFSEDNPGLVHRIDKDTSGLLVACKTQKALDSLAEQFQKHHIERVYHAIVLGEMKGKQGTIDQPIGRSAADYRKRAVYEAAESFGKYAITHYWVEGTGGGLTHIRCSLDTGRTHQIRVHLQHLGYPLLGDTMYKQYTEEAKQLTELYKSKLDRQALHANVLGFKHPISNQYMRFTSPYPSDFEKVLEAMASANSTMERTG